MKFKVGDKVKILSKPMHNGTPVDQVNTEFGKFKSSVGRIGPIKSIVIMCTDGAFEVELPKKCFPKGYKRRSWYFHEDQLELIPKFEINAKVRVKGQDAEYFVQWFNQDRTYGVRLIDSPFLGGLDPIFTEDELELILPDTKAEDLEEDMVLWPPIQELKDQLAQANKKIDELDNLYRLRTNAHCDTIDQLAAKNKEIAELKEICKIQAKDIISIITNR